MTYSCTKASRIAVAFALAACGVGAASTASAAACVRTYQVNLALELINIGGDAGTLAGTVCTNGTTGTLAASDIVEWNLTLTNPFLVGAGLPFVFSHTGPGALVRLDTNYGATPLSATSTELLFDFTPAPDGSSYKFFGFEQTISGLSDGLGGTYTQERFFYWYVSGNFRTRYYGYDNPDPFPGGGQATYTRDPAARIGTSTPPVVPEPGSLALAALALAALAALRVTASRRRSEYARGAQPALG